MSNANRSNGSAVGTTSATTAADPISSPHAVSIETVFAALKSSLHGLSRGEAVTRLKQYGRNTLFKSPLIYVLVAAAILSIVIKEWSDAGFISAVLMINAVIGTVMEYSAQRAATALQELVNTRCRILREGET
jgi:magnesium-transporting ATPase (P-type)